MLIYQASRFAVPSDLRILFLAMILAPSPHSLQSMLYGLTTPRSESDGYPSIRLSNSLVSGAFRQRTSFDHPSGDHPPGSTQQSTTRFYVDFPQWLLCWAPTQTFLKHAGTSTAVLCNNKMPTTRAYDVLSVCRPCVLTNKTDSVNDNDLGVLSALSSIHALRIGNSSQRE